MALRTCQLSSQLVLLCPLTQPHSQKESLWEWPLVGCCHPQRQLCFSLSHCPHVTPYNSSPVLPAVLNASCMHAQSCLTLCNPMGYSPPGASIHGVFQARILEWVAIPFSRGSSQSRDQTHVSSIFCIGKHSLPLSHPGSSKYLSVFPYSTSIPPPRLGWNVISKEAEKLAANHLMYMNWLFIPDLVLAEGEINVKAWLGWSVGAWRADPEFHWLKTRSKTGKIGLQSSISEFTYCFKT